MAMRSYPLEKSYQFIEPSPVILVATAWRGQFNLATVSCHVAMDFSPRIGLCLGPWNTSFDVLRKTRECVIAIPGADLMRQVVGIGNCSGHDVDKFAKFGLTAKPARHVAAPLVVQCLANLECRVIDTHMVKSHNFFVLQAVHAWRDTSRKEQRTFHAIGNGTFVIDGETVNLRRQMTKWQDCI